MIRVFEKSSPDFQRRLDALCNRSSELGTDIEAAARKTIAKVRAGGDAAVRALTAKFDKRQLDALELPAAEWDALAARVAPDVRAAIEHAARRVRVFHERERHASYEISEEGVRVGSRVDPLARIGIYVPGGKARYPSTVIMTAIPARVAGVREIVMTTPGPSPETLAAARLAGVDRVFVIGGAQAIAAMAYGTESVPRVDKIVGPGNAYVAAAKRLVFGDVGIDSIAGPTEVVIAADDSVDPRWIAADLLAQAEHDELAVPILIARGKALADAVAAAVVTQLAELPRRAIADPVTGRPGRDLRRRRRRRGRPARQPAGARTRVAGAPRCARAAPRRSRPPGRCSSARTRPSPWATTSPAPATCCPPAAARASRRRWACATSSSGRRSSNTTPPR